jgi:hypothetical protein
LILNWTMMTMKTIFPNLAHKFGSPVQTVLTAAKLFKMPQNDLQQNSKMTNPMRMLTTNLTKIICITWYRPKPPCIVKP